MKELAVEIAKYLRKSRQGTELGYSLHLPEARKVIRMVREKAGSEK